MSKVWWRFNDIKARGIAKSRTQLNRLQKLYGFPKGRMLSANIRGFDSEEVIAWEQTRPIAGPELRGEAKRRHERKLKADTEPTQADAGQETSLVESPQPRGAGKTPRSRPRKRAADAATEAATA